MSLAGNGTIKAGVLFLPCVQTAACLLAYQDDHRAGTHLIALWVGQ
jgi:hypothetical protein